MAFSFSTWSIRNPVPPILLFVMLVLAGIVAFLQLPITAAPPVITTDVDVLVIQPGATPSELEMQTTQRIEDAVATLQGVKRVTSTITEGQSLTKVEFNLNIGLDRAINDVRNAVAAIRQDLPTTVREPIITRSANISRPVGIYVAEAPEMPPTELGWFIDRTIARSLMTVPGVSRVQRRGGGEQEISIVLDPQKVTALGLSAADVSRQLAAANIDLPGGRLTLGDTEYALRTTGRADNLDALAGMRIALGDGREAKLSDLGTVSLGASETRTISRVDGRPAVMFLVFKEDSASEVAVADAVNERLDELAKQHGVAFKLGFSEVGFVKTGYKSTMWTFVEGAVLTVLVIFLFLRDFRATIISALAIPLSIVPTFLAMQWLGFTLNIVSLLAITLVTGVLVDDAIVEIENIHRHMRQGKSPMRAAIDAADEIGISVIATTLVICAVFVPVSFMAGLPGLFFRQFGLTVAIAAFFSLVVARTITPMLASRLLRPTKHDHEATDPTVARYLHLVEWTLAHRYKTLGIAAICVLGSFGLAPLLPAGFLPYDDYSLASVTVEVPRGSTIEQTDAAAQKISAILRKRPEVEYVLSTVGESNGEVHRARIYVKLIPPNQRAISEREFRNQMYPQIAGLPDIRANFENFTGIKDVSIALISDDADALDRAAEALKREMHTLQGLTNIDTSVGQKQPEIKIEMDPVKAAQLGITAQQVGEAIGVSTIGDDTPRLSKFLYQDREIPVRVRLPRDFGRDLGALENMKLRTADGGSVPLSTVARLRFSTGPVEIQRYDRQRRIDLEANLDGIALGEALKRIDTLAAKKNLPKGVRVLETGDAEFLAELMISFFKALGTGLLLIYSIQVLLYKDWLQPLARMMALPLSVGGALLLLFVTGMEMSMPALIGMMMLMGIADKNSILLVDAMLERIRGGMAMRDAIVESCRVRARPIVMTSVAMIVGMLPVAFGFSLDSAFRAPMAVAVIGGLLSSTALSLIFVPVLFSFVYDFERWLGRRFASRRGRADDEDAEERLPAAD
ncbi:MAG: efflux RND transporter permease subunit [Lysobacter sp.]|nr:MAG: efflux RND transporter permease subunit [Lysobacter sp.]